MSYEVCPLCSHHATFKSTENPEGQRYKCQDCGEFWIDDYAISYLARIPESNRHSTLEKLSAQVRRGHPAHVCVIRQPRPSEITGDGHGVARLSLMTEWVGRSSHQS